MDRQGGPGLGGVVRRRPGAIDATYREAMEAWRKSQADAVVRTVQHTESGDGKATTKTSIRTRSQCGNAAFLTRALAAATASWRLKGKPGLQGAEAIPPAAAPFAAPVPMTKPTDDEAQIPEPDTVEAETVEAEKARLEFLEKEDLEQMSHEELRDVAEGLKGVIDADGGTVAAEVVDQDVDHMNEDQLGEYRSRLFAAIEAVGELAAVRAIDTEDSPDKIRASSGKNPPLVVLRICSPDEIRASSGKNPPLVVPRTRSPGEFRASSGKNPPLVVLESRTLSTPRRHTPPE